MITSADMYSLWTEPFSPGSGFSGSWTEGANMQFIGPNPDGSAGTSGMDSVIRKADYPHLIEIEHLGQILNGVVDRTSDQVKAWLPAFEIYRLTDLGSGHTRMEVEMDAVEEYADMFNESWPAALQVLKELSEGR